MRAVSQAGPGLTLRPPGPGDEDVARAAQAFLAPASGGGITWPGWSAAGWASVARS